MKQNAFIKYLETLGDTQTALLYGVSQYTARGWRLGNSSPSAEMMRTIFSRTPAAVTYQSIIEARKPSKFKAG
jgi:hypothetical protein